MAHVPPRSAAALRELGGAERDHLLTRVAPGGSFALRSQLSDEPYGACHGFLCLEGVLAGLDKSTDDMIRTIQRNSNGPFRGC